MAVLRRVDTADAPLISVALMDKKFEEFFAATMSTLTVYVLVAHPFACTTGMDRPAGPQQYDYDQRRSGERLNVGRPVALATSTSTAGELFTTTFRMRT
jgi:hypothetical protein